MFENIRKCDFSMKSARHGRMHDPRPYGLAFSQRLLNSYKSLSVALLIMCRPGFASDRSTCLRVVIAPPFLNTTGISQAWHGPRFSLEYVSKGHIPSQRQRHADILLRNGPQHFVTLSRRVPPAEMCKCSSCAMSPRARRLPSSEPQQ